MANIIGTNGDDYLDGTSGADLLDGGLGNDYLYGGLGDDTYVFGIGDGQDFIEDDGGNDTIVLGPGILPSDLIVSVSTAELFQSLYWGIKLEIAGTSDSVFIFGADADADYIVEKIQFDDGSIWSITADGLVPYPYLNPTNGNDILIGSSGADAILGLAGDDVLNGLAGNDRLTGGTGNDVLNGAEGSDNYYFNLGDGVDTINDVYAANDRNEIHFGAGITSDSLNFGLDGNSLVIRIGDGGDAIYVVNIDTTNIYANGSLPIDRLYFSNGSYTGLSQLISQKGFDTFGTEGGDSLGGALYVHDRIYGFGGNDILDPSFGVFNGSGSDYLAGGAGDDIYYDYYDTIVENPDEGIDTIYSIRSNITLEPNIENLFLWTIPDNPNATRVAYGNELNNVITGDTGNDYLYGGAGDDVLEGGQGVDVLYGGTGNDIYVFGRGQGNDAASEFGGTSTDTESVRFVGGLTSSDILVTNSGFDVLLTIADTGEQLKLLGSLASPPSFIEQAVFDDGSVWEITPTGLVFLRSTVGTAGNDTLRGTNWADTLNGTDGDDVIYGNSGDDYITGGTGNDILYGGFGNDTYYFDVGNGTDTIYDYAGENNVLVFGTGVDPASITLNLGSLFINIGNGVGVHLEGFDPNDVENTNIIDSFVFHDGTTLNFIELLVRGFDIDGTGTDDILNGTNVIDRITGGDGNDTLNGGKGNDILNGGGGNDTYLYSAGDGVDTLTDSSGNDTISFGAGISFANTVIRKEGTTAHLRLLDADGNETSQGMDIALNEDGTSPVEVFSFTDGSRYTLDDLLIRSQTTTTGNGSDTVTTGRNDDTVTTGNGNDTVHSGTGNDILYGGNGSDDLYGEGGNDSLFGGNGKDLLDGGAGNDLLDGGNGKNTLTGGQGNDTLVLGEDSQNDIHFNSGDGWDTLKTNAKDSNLENDIYFGNGITQNNLWFSRSGNSLQVNILGTTDGMTIEDWYSYKYRPIDEFKTSDGYELDDKKVALLVQAMASFTPTPGSGGVLPTEMPDQLQATLAAAWESS